VLADSTLPLPRLAPRQLPRLLLLQALVAQIVLHRRLPQLIAFTCSCRWSVFSRDISTWTSVSRASCLCAAATAANFAAPSLRKVRSRAASLRRTRSSELLRVQYERPGGQAKPFTQKLHFMEAHAVAELQVWRTGGLVSEEPSESNHRLQNTLDASNASLRSTVKRVKANLWKRDLFTRSNVLEAARDRAERRSTGRNARRTCWRRRATAPNAAAPVATPAERAGGGARPRRTPQHSNKC